MNAPWLFWHRRDLRLADNLGLAQLAERTTAITGLVLLEPGLWQGPEAAPSRLWFLRPLLMLHQRRQPGHGPPHHLRPLCGHVAVAGGRGMLRKTAGQG